MKDPEKILLYWSGEANDSLSREVESMLNSEKTARAYLDELNELGVALQDPGVPDRRDGLLDEILVQQDEVSRVIYFPSRLLWATAVILIAAVALSYNLKPWSDSAAPMVANPPSAPEPEVQAPKLSERLLSRSGSFSGTHNRLGKSYRQRSRWEKLQIQPPKT